LNSIKFKGILILKISFKKFLKTFKTLFNQRLKGNFREGKWAK